MNYSDHESSLECHTNLVVENLNQLLNELNEAFSIEVKVESLRGQIRRCRREYDEMKKRARKALSVSRKNYPLELFSRFKSAISEAQTIISGKEVANVGKRKVLIPKNVLDRASAKKNSEVKERLDGTVVKRAKCVA